VGKRKVVRNGRRRLTGIDTPLYRGGPIGPAPAPTATLGKRREGVMERPFKGKRLRFGNKQTSYGPMSFRKARFGRGRRVTVKKLQRMTMTAAILRFQGVKRYGLLSNTAINAGPTEAAGASDMQENKVDLSGSNGQPGFFRLRNTNSAESNTVGVTDEMPLHVYDLTVCPNKTGNPVNGYTLGFIQDSQTARPTFGTIQGLNPLGQTATGYNFEYTTVPVTGDAGTGVVTPQCKAKYIKHEWFDIRLLVYGQRQFTTYYDIMIVRFNEDYLAPEQTVFPVSDTEADNKRLAFWQAMVKNITYNPLLPGHSSAFNGMKVIRRYRCVLDSSSQDSADRTPAHKVFKIFFRDGVIRNYDYGSRPHTQLTHIDGPNYSQNIRINDLNDTPMPKGRLYLIVRASNTTPETDTEDMDGQPSYDLVIRKKIRFEPFQ